MELRLSPAKFMSAIGVAVIGVAYLLGSIPSGFILAARAGVDVRKTGSGNVGATNVARVLGRRQGIYTLLADAAKGFIPVFVADQLGLTDMTVALVAIAAFLGHLFPVFLRFKGGKGVATALGVFLALAPLAMPVLIVVFSVVVWVTRIVSLSSMITAIAAPGILWCFGYPAVVVEASGFLAALIILRHRSNIQRLLAGTEPKFSS